MIYFDQFVGFVKTNLFTIYYVKRKGIFRFDKLQKLEVTCISFKKGIVAGPKISQVVAISGPGPTIRYWAGPYFAAPTAFGTADFQ